MDFDKYRRTKSYVDPRSGTPADREAFGEYYKEELHLRELFRQDALQEAGLIDHPKAERAFQLAWSLGWEKGPPWRTERFNKVFEILVEITGLVKD